MTRRNVSFVGLTNLDAACIQETTPLDSRHFFLAPLDGADKCPGDGEWWKKVARDIGVE